MIIIPWLKPAVRPSGNILNWKSYEIMICLRIESNHFVHRTKLILVGGLNPSEKYESQLG